MTPTTSHSQGHTTERIFGSPEQVLKETSRLGELISFDRILSKLPFGCTRLAVLKRTTEIWQPVLDVTHDNFEHTKHKLLEQVQPERKTMPNAVSNLLTAKINATTTAAELHKVARRILKDCTSAMVSPVKKSQVGHTGPTLLVGYSKSNLKDHFSLIAYVLKWTNLEEICGNMLYTSFLTNFGQRPFNGISIPKNCGFNFEPNMHKTEDGRLVPVDTQTASQLRVSLQSAVSSLDPTIKLYGEQLLVTERIQGENLFDFARFKYETLTEAQKKQLFYNIGKLVPFDLVLGNDDRMLQLTFDRDYNYSLDIYESNVGNVMVSQDKKNGEPELFAIDNALQVEHIVNKPVRAKYLKFIRELFSAKTPEIAMAKHMVQSFERGFISTADDVQPSAKEALQQLQPILNEIPTLALPAFEAGIRDGIALLRDELIPAWNSDRSAELKKQLAALHPALLEAVEERINAFPTTKDTV